MGSPDNKKNFSMKHVLEADGMELSFGERRILSDIYIRCETGQITGLLGRNGQGKSCLLRILYGKLPGAGGSVRIDGSRVRQSGQLLYLPQFDFIPGLLTLKRVLKDYGLQFGELEDRFPELSHAYGSRIRDLSGGQRRLVQLFVLLRSAASFVLLDEPFTHLMPLQIEQVREMLLEEKPEKGIILTDHLFRDVTAVSDQIYLLADGKTHLVRTEEDIERLGYARI